MQFGVTISINVIKSSLYIPAQYLPEDRRGARARVGPSVPWEERAGCGGTAAGTP